MPWMSSRDVKVFDLSFGIASIRKRTSLMDTSLIASVFWQWPRFRIFGPSSRSGPGNVSLILFTKHTDGITTGNLNKRVQRMSNLNSIQQSGMERLGTMNPRIRIAGSLTFNVNVTHPVVPHAGWIRDDVFNFKVTNLVCESVRCSYGFNVALMARGEKPPTSRYFDSYTVVSDEIKYCGGL
ncbi:hypothetical protein C8Q75DRAFT_737496 [Abortiporus biennis]|nr:hypothetical protein C8Q75DRAFT_737496 [Abortiporus biennis]